MPPETILNVVDAPKSDSQGGANTPPPAGGQTGGGAPAASSQPPASGSFKDQLPAEFRDNPMFANVDSIETLAKSYAHAQSAIGKKGIIPPNEKSSDEEWGKFFKELGQPELDKYEVTLPKEAKANEEFIKKFKTTAHASGLLPKQAQKLVEWYLGEETSTARAKQEAQAQKVKENIESLKKEWGEAFPQEVQSTMNAIKELGGQELLDHVNKSGYGADPVLVKAFNKLSKMMSEDQIRGENNMKFGMSPAEIQEEINKMMFDLSHPYHDRTHMGHKAAVEKMTSLYKKLSPS